MSKRDLPRDLLKRMMEDDIELLRGKRSDGAYAYASHDRMEASRQSESFSIERREEVVAPGAARPVGLPARRQRSVAADARHAQPARLHRTDRDRISARGGDVEQSDRRSDVNGGSGRLCRATSISN